MVKPRCPFSTWGGVGRNGRILELLPASVRRRYEDSLALVRDTEEQEECPKPFLGVSPDKDLQLISHLEEKHLVILQTEKPRVVNGIFAVPKEETRQKLIIDARPANAVLRPPSKVGATQHWKNCKPLSAYPHQVVCGKFRHG
jgi:hypothetical protein